MTTANARRIGICFGTNAGKMETYEEHPRFLDRGVRGIHPSVMFELSPHGVSSHVAIELGACGVCGSVSTGCTAGLDALNWGYLQLSSGHATAMVVGGAEALLSPFAFGSVCAQGYSQNATTHPRKLPRPFELHRDGMVLSEGAGAVVLETMSQALERDARIYGEVSGVSPRARDRSYSDVT